MCFNCRELGAHGLKLPHESTRESARPHHQSMFDGVRRDRIRLDSAVQRTLVNGDIVNQGA